MPYGSGRQIRYLLQIQVITYNIRTYILNKNDGFISDMQKAGMTV